MVTWNPVRIPNFIANKHSSKQSTLSIDSPLSRPPPLEPMRAVKRNVFPANLLKSKLATHQTSNRCSSRSCRIQIHDLTRKACDLVSSRISGLRSYGTLRRSRSERKEDWDMAMFWLKEGHESPPRDKIRETQRAFLFPVLETIMAEEDSRQIMRCNDLPVMLLMPPPRKISMLSVESNMCFETEFLKSLCADTRDNHVQRHTNDGCRFASILHPIEEGAPKKLIDPCSRRTGMEYPVMKPMIQKRTIRRLKRDLLESEVELLLLPRPDKADTATSASKNLSNLEKNMSALKNMDKYKISILEAVKKATRLIKSSSTSAIVSKNSSEGIFDDVHLLEKDDVANAYRYAVDIGKPVLLRNILGSNDYNVKRKLTWKVPIPEPRSTAMHTNVFQSLSELRRCLLTSEKSTWSKASKDVMSRAKYKRRRMLSPHHQIVSVILSSGHCSARLTVVSSPGSDCEVLDFLVFPRLRFILTRYNEKKSRTTALLDKLDFVAEHVAKSRQKFLTRCYQRVTKMLHKYDPPTRKWSQVHFEKIRSRYKRLKPCSAEADEKVGKHSLLEEDEVDSDESVLDDFVLSDEELEGQNFGENGLGVLEEIRQDLRHHGHVKTRMPMRNAEEEQTENRELPDLSVGTRKKLKVRLKVPDALVCAPWVIQVADQCVTRMPRGSVFVPPPLSVLPIAAVVTSTHLRDSVRDQRVVVVCESQTDVTDYIREYLQSSLGESVSIDSIKRSECDGVESIVPLPHTTARVVDLDNFCFSFSITFSLLIVFVNREAGDSAEYVRLRDQVFDSHVSQWVRIPFVLVAPLDARLGLQPYSKAVRRISERLRAQQILWVKTKDEVYDSVVISGPRSVYLAPAQQATHLASLLDSFAAPYLQTYMNLERTYTPQIMGRSSNLQDVNLRFVRETMEEAFKGNTSGQSQRLELLYDLRQARTFAIYDGFDIAVAFLEHCAKQSKGQVRRVVSKILENLEDQRDEITSHIHPVLKVLTKCVEEAEESMLQDPPSLRSIHRRDRFRPLIVANSQEAVNGCLQGLENTALCKEATENNIAVCSLQDFNTKSKKPKRVELREKLGDFSHVFHIVDDRYDVPSDLLLPPVLLQHVHAGRTRLMTIAVDETRELDDRWKHELSCYDNLSRALEKEEFGDTAYTAPYLQQISVESFWSVLKNTLPGCDDPVKKAVEPSETRGPNVSMSHRNGFIQQNPGTLHLSSREVCSSTVDSLRAMLNKHLVMMPNDCLVLRVFVHIQPHEKCSPAATYLHSAIAGSERLQQKVVVDTMFLF